MLVLETGYLDRVLLVMDTPVYRVPLLGQFMMTPLYRVMVVSWMPALRLSYSKLEH